MKVTLRDILWIGDPNHFTPAQAQNFYGQPRRHVRVVYHHPGVRVTNAESWVRNTLTRQQESYHFVVEGRKLIQTVSMNNVSFSAATASSQWNTDSIHVCVIPEKADYEFLGALHKFIETYYGRLPGVGHGSLMPTQCPGNVNVSRIMDRARGRVTKPAPTDDLYRVRKDGKQLGAYKIERNAYNRFVQDGADEITHKGKDVTNAVVKRQEEVVMQEKIDQLTKELKKVRAENKELNKQIGVVIEQHNFNQKELDEAEARAEKAEAELEKCINDEDTQLLNGFGTLLMQLIRRLGLRREE